MVLGMFLGALIFASGMLLGVAFYKVGANNGKMC